MKPEQNNQKLFKTKLFHKWATKEKVSDVDLTSAVEEIRHGLIDAILGGSIIKKRVGMPGKGKSGSYRTIIAFRRSQHVFFIYRFAKNQRDNINSKELYALKRLAQELFKLNEKQIVQAINKGELFEVKTDG